MSSIYISRSAAYEWYVYKWIDWQFGFCESSEDVPPNCLWYRLVKLQTQEWLRRNLAMDHFWLDSTFWHLFSPPSTADDRSYFANSPFKN